MRINTEQARSTAQVQSWNPQGTVLRESYVKESGFTTYQLRRSDITHVPFDAYGFRPPSAYFSEVLNVEQVTGHYYTTNDYFRAAKLSDRGERLKATLSGNLLVDKVLSVNDLPGFPAPSQNRTFVITKALGDLKNQHVNLAMTLAFSGQTSRMISTRATHLLHSYQRAKRGDFEGALRTIAQHRPKGLKRDTASSLYLEWLFGWCQLASDVSGIADELSSQSKDKMSYVYGRYGVSDEYPISSGPTMRSAGGLGNYGYLSSSGTRKAASNAVAIGRVTSSGLRRTASLGFTNPAELAWDMLPWSWVLDQFANVGSYLGAFDCTAGLEFVGGSHTLYQSREATFNFEPIADYVSGSGVSNIRHRHYLQGSKPGVIRHTTSTRTLFTSADAGLTIRNPFKANLKVAAAAMAALLLAASGGKPKRNF